MLLYLSGSSATVAPIRPPCCRSASRHPDLLVPGQNAGLNALLDGGAPSTRASKQMGNREAQTPPKTFPPTRSFYSEPRPSSPSRFFIYLIFACADARLSEYAAVNSLALLRRKSRSCRREREDNFYFSCSQYYEYKQTSSRPP